MIHRYSTEITVKDKSRKLKLGGIKMILQAFKRQWKKKTDEANTVSAKYSQEKIVREKWFLHLNA